MEPDVRMYHSRGKLVYCILVNPYLVTLASCTPIPRIFIKIFAFIEADIRGVTGGTDQTSGGCSLCYTIPI